MNLINPYVDYVKAALAKYCEITDDAAVAAIEGYYEELKNGIDSIK